MKKETLKQVLTSILIGTAISILTAILEWLAGYTNGVGNEVIGSGAGVVSYLRLWKSNRTG